MRSDVLSIAKFRALPWPPRPSSSTLRVSDDSPIRRGRKGSADEQIPRAARIRLPKDCRFDDRDEIGGAA